MIAFALANWKWALIAGALLWGAGEHTWRVTLQRDAAREVTEAQKKVADARAADAVKTGRLEAEHAALVKALQEKANERDIAIARAPRSDSCIHTDAARAFLGGLSGPDKAGAAQPRPAAGTGPRLSR